MTPAPLLTPPGSAAYWGTKQARLLFLCVIATLPAFGVTIERVFVPVGQPVPGVGLISLPEPENTRGNGDFVEIINAACDIWELALRDDHTLTLYFAWAQTYSGRAEHYGLTFSPDPARETSGSILFDATPDGPFLFYLDPTPYTNEEYRFYGEDVRDYGGGPIVVARTFFAPTGAAADPRYHDLLSIAVHEIGHALGLSFSHPAFNAIRANGAIAIDAPRPFAGTFLPLAENFMGGFSSHLAGPYDEQFVLGLGEGTSGMRFLPTEGDILALAQLSRLELIELDPHPVVATYLPGLAVDYFTSETAFANFADFERMAPATHGVTDQIRFPPGTKPWPGLDARFRKNWGARFMGAVKVETAGIHTFHLQHAGGMRLTLGHVAQVQPGGAIGPLQRGAVFVADTISGTALWHPGIEREDDVRVWLDSGYHHFGLEFVENEAEGGCVVAWSGPGFPRQLLPPAALLRPGWAEITGPPVIVAPPQPLHLRPGTTGELRLHALALPAAAYQWRRDGAALVGATSATLVLAAAAPADSGLYDCVVTNLNGSTTSVAVAVTISESP